jgi:hypothetical protein
LIFEPILGSRFPSQFKESSMAVGSKVWGAYWLGNAAFWGDLRQAMGASWNEKELANSGMLSNRHNISVHQSLSLDALHALLTERNQENHSALFYGFQAKDSESFGLTLANAHTSMPEIRFAEIAARGYGLAGPYTCRTRGVVGGLELVALAQERLAAGIPRAICLAGPGINARLEPSGGAGIALALGLGSGMEKGIGCLGPVKIGSYEGIPDTGAQADFLECLGFSAMGGKSDMPAAILLNEPLDYKWQAALNAAARRVAPVAPFYALPMDAAYQACGLMLIMAALFIDQPSLMESRLVLAVDDEGRAGAVKTAPH